MAFDALKQEEDIQTVWISMHKEAKFELCQPKEKVTPDLLKWSVGTATVSSQPFSSVTVRYCNGLCFGIEKNILKDFYCGSHYYILCEKSESCVADASVLSASSLLSFN